MRTTTRLTPDEREAIREDQQEQRRVMRSLKTAMNAMSTSQHVALLAIAREMAWPGTMEEILYNHTRTEPARALGLA